MPLLWRGVIAAVFAIGTSAGSVGATDVTMGGVSSIALEITDSRMNEQVVMIPAISGNVRINLETTVFKPSGTGPFPLVIMNHGKEPGDPRLQKRDRFLVMSREFVKRGYAVVVPMRKGFSRSTGQYSDYGCNMTGNGYLQANDLHSTLEYLQTQPWVDRNHIVMAGQSYGGLATMAFGTRNFPGVRGLINFAGGLRTDGGTCQWQASLVNAMADYGSRSSTPSLWFYGANDSYFNHEVATKMHHAYQSSGGNAQLVAYGPFKRDAHSMVASRDGVSIWWPETEKFLRKIGMPTTQTVALLEPNAPRKSNYASLDNVEAIPFLKEKGREAYRAFLSKSLPRAFAVSPSGAWSWAEEGDDPVERVLSSCQKASGQACKLYAVDEMVVWSDDSSVPVQEKTATAVITAPAATAADVNAQNTVEAQILPVRGN